MPKVFAEHSTPYVMAAMMDFVETHKRYRYSTQNLGAVLHNLHPRPRALVIGIAVHPSLVGEMTAEWENYVQVVLKKECQENDEWKKNVCAPVRIRSAKCHFRRAKLRYSYRSHIMWTQAWDVHRWIWDGRSRCSGSWMLYLDLEWYGPWRVTGSRNLPIKRSIHQ